MFEALLPVEIFAILLVFVRVGSAVMLLPGIGDPYVSPRVRLLFALLLAFLVTPTVRESLPAMPGSGTGVILIVLGEAVIGIFLGGLGRLMMAAMTTAGMIIASMTSLANALVDDPSAQQQGSIAGSFLSLVAMIMIFVLDLHHLLIRGLVGSYEIFLPGAPLPVGDLSEVVTRTVSASFLLAFQISAPFVVVGLVFYLGIGLLSRLMPQVQTFFVALPLQVAMGLVGLLIVLPVSMRWFVMRFQETVLPFFGAG